MHNVTLTATNLKNNQCILLFYKQRKSRAIVITRLLWLMLLSWCQNFNVAHSSKSIKGINNKLAQHDSCMKRGITLKAIVLELSPLFN